MNWYSTKKVARIYEVSQRTASRWAHREDYQPYVRYHKGVYEFNENFFDVVVNNKTPRKDVSSNDRPSDNQVSVNQNNDTQSDTNKTPVLSGNEWEELRRADEIILPKDEYFELVRYITDTSNYRSKYEELEKQSEARIQDLKETISKAQEDIKYYRGQIAYLQGQMDKLLMSARERNLIDYTSLQKDIIRHQSDTQKDNKTHVQSTVFQDSPTSDVMDFVDWLSRTGEKGG